MCGICGFNFADKSLINNMCNLIKHRGPDDVGYYEDSEISLGIRRLSVIDKETGHQPQHNENLDIWVIFNGEIYNFIDLRDELEKRGHNFYTKSDTEIIVHSYEEWGENCVKKFRGQFAFCIYDTKKRIIFLARDQMGLKPIYFYFDGEKFIFGSEIKCILVHDVKRIFNREAFNVFLSLKYIPFNFTLFKGIQKIPPSSFLVFNLKTKQYRVEKYWNLKFDDIQNENVNILANQLRNLFEESVKARLISEVPLGLFLSGGIDSSSVLAIMSKNMSDPVKTFSIGFEEGAPINETKYSKFVADYFNADHQEIILKSSCYEILPDLVWHLDDLITDPAILPVYYLAKFAKEKITVALTGDGADEIFGGYSIYYTSKPKYLNLIPKKLLDLLINFDDYIPNQKLRMSLNYYYNSYSSLDRFIRIISGPYRDKKVILPFKAKNIQNTLKEYVIDHLDPINQYINWDLKFQLPNKYNMKIDKMSMAASIEARVPFLDLNIVNWASKIPTNLKIKGMNEKYILRLAMKDLLPKVIIERKKLGFGTPINLWLNKDFKDASECILERLEGRSKIIRSEYIKKIKRNRLKQSYHNEAWSLIMFELWYETFFENQSLEAISLN